MCIIAGTKKLHPTTVNTSSARFHSVFEYSEAYDENDNIDPDMLTFFPVFLRFSTLRSSIVETIDLNSVIRSRIEDFRVQLFLPSRLSLASLGVSLAGLRAVSP